MACILNVARSVVGALCSVLGHARHNIFVFFLVDFEDDAGRARTWQGRFRNAGAARRTIRQCMLVTAAWLMCTAYAVAMLCVSHAFAPCCCHALVGACSVQCCVSSPVSCKCTMYTLLWGLQHEARAVYLSTSLPKCAIALSLPLFDSIAYPFACAMKVCARVCVCWGVASCK